MKIYIANKGESFEQAKARAEHSTIEYRGFTIRKHWNGFDFKGITIGYKFKTEQEAKDYADLMITQIQEAASSEPTMEWPETR